MAPLIRPARPEDAAALSTVIRAAYAPYRQAGLALPPVDEGIADDIARYAVWVAELDGIVTGGVIASRAPDSVHVMNLAVDPSASGQGLGNQLLAQVIAWAQSEGLTTLHLASHRDMARTLAFYRRLGWQETGREGEKVYMTLHPD